MPIRNGPTVRDDDGKHERSGETMPETVHRRKTVVTNAGKSESGSRILADGDQAKEKTETYGENETRHQAQKENDPKKFDIDYRQLTEKQAQ